MPRTAHLFACLIAWSIAASPANCEPPRTTVILEVLLPEDARLFIEGVDTRSTGSMRRFESTPLSPGKYVYSLKAIIPGTNGAETVTRVVDVRPGDFEEIDFRPRSAGERVPDVLFEGTPPEAVEALLKLANIKAGDVLWDLGCGDGRIPVAAALKYGIKARGFEIDVKCLEDARLNVLQNAVDDLVDIEDRDIFTLDLSRGPTVVTLYLLPSLNAKLLPQLQKLPAGARVLSVGHRMADIPPDDQVTVDTPDGDYTHYLWRVDTLR
ncbi:MAG TPA: TIGR03000 domain-containing protein, partial [Planctomycetia bacterium]|nr:TIGR03000 domain-containing protein [Planctomycetia bacterium]